MGYDYTCKGTGYSGGEGGICSGKYSVCSCSDGYKWKDGACIKLPWGQCSGSAKNCSIGDILFNDGTCNARPLSGKTPIAVVVYKSSDGKCGQAMALNSVYLGASYQWATSYNDYITSLPESEEPKKDFKSCENSAKIIAAGDKSKYPAAWAAHEYSTEGTSAGDWCLPAAGTFISYYENSATVNAGLSRAGALAFISEGAAWTSSQSSSGYAWIFYDSSYPYIVRVEKDESQYYDYPRYIGIKVRPVIEF